MGRKKKRENLSERLQRYLPGGEKNFSGKKGRGKLKPGILFLLSKQGSLPLRGGEKRVATRATERETTRRLPLNVGGKRRALVFEVQCQPWRNAISH